MFHIIKKCSPPPPRQETRPRFVLLFWLQHSAPGIVCRGLAGMPACLP